MEISEISTTRDTGGGGAGLGGTAGTGSVGGGVKKADDDGDLRKRGSWLGDCTGGNIHFLDRGAGARVAERLRRSGMRLVHRHLHTARQLPAAGRAVPVVKESVPTPVVTVEIQTATHVVTVSAGINVPPLPQVPQVPQLPGVDDIVGTIRSSGQIVLSSTPPPSPAESGTTFFPTVTPPPTTSVNTTTTNSHTPLSPITTITTHHSSPPRNATLISTSWSYTTTQQGNTVLVIGYPKEQNATSVKLQTASKKIKTSSQSIFSTQPLTVTDYGGGGGGQTPTGPTSIPESPTGDSGSGRATVSPKVLGGVLGGLAGFGIVLVVILILIRRHKRNAIVQARVEAGYGGPPGSSGDTGGIMAERSSLTPIAGAASFFSRQSRQSQFSEPASEERGFYKVSGRKLPPVIGGPRPDHTSSYYQDDDGKWHGGPTSPGPSTRLSGATTSTASPTVPHTPAPAIGIALSPPGRIAEEGEISHVPPDPQQQPPQRRDGLGRSLASLDGSRASRFTEDIV